MAQARHIRTSTSRAIAGSQELPWKTCAGLPDYDRIWIKEQAATAGLAFCKQLASLFEDYNTTEIYDEKSASDKERLESWLRYIDRLISRHREFNVLVGVAGATGSGKTSALNALLGYRELLPTNNQEASTAVPCKIAYNNNDDVSRRFIGQVKFRDRKDIKKQLGEFFGDLKTRQELRDGDSTQDYDALRELEANLKPTFEMINTLWGLEQDDVESISVENLLDSKPEIYRLLGTTKEFHNSEVEDFSEMVRPYMDSTAAVHGESCLEFAAWPLVEKVDLFVKSDILRNGVTLVDLPGLSDSVESRAAVAEKYFANLCATLIFCPAPRAADECTGVKLMSDHQEQRLQMNGKFHKRSFCVVVSQMDRIDCKAALREKAAKENTRLQQLLGEKEALTERLKQMQTLLRDDKIRLSKLSAVATDANNRLQLLNNPNKKIQRYSSLSEARRVRTKANMDREVKKDAVIKLWTKTQHMEQKMENLEGEIIFICVKERNRLLEKRFNKDFARRQRRIITAGLGDAYDGTVQVCPISAMAYWGTKGEKATSGFPSEEHTGVPNLAQWIRSATIAEREHHIMGVLHDVESLYNHLRTWSKDESAQARVQVDRKRVEVILQNFVDIFESELKSALEGLSDSARKYDPLQGKRKALRRCKQKCVHVVQSWTYKNPSDVTSREKIHWLTYDANIRHKGMPFVSRSGGKYYTYHWMEDIASILRETIVTDWNKALNRDIPNLTEPVANEIDALANSFMRQLRRSTARAVPGFLPFLPQIRQAMENIKEQVKDRMSARLRRLSRDASDIHPELAATFQEKWTRSLGKALSIRGRGSFARRQEFLAVFAAGSNDAVFRAAFEHLAGRMKHNLEDFLYELVSISEFAKQSIMTQIDAILNKVILPSIKDKDVAADKLALQQYVRAVLQQWHVTWNTPELNEESRDRAIPETYWNLAGLQYDSLKYDTVKTMASTYSDDESAGEEGGGEEGMVL